MDCFRTAVALLNAALILPHAEAQVDLERIWRDELDLRFVVQPIRDPEVFGVGAIVSGRGKRFAPQCYTHQCLPEKPQLLRDGTVQLNPYPRTTLRRARASESFLRLLNLDARRGAFRYVEIVFEEPMQEEIDLVGAAHIVREFMSDLGRELLFDRRRPRKEIVIMAVRCKTLKFKFYDAKGKSATIPVSSGGAEWTRVDAYTGALTNVWFGIRTARLERTSQPPSSPSEKPDLILKRAPTIHRPPGIPASMPKTAPEYFEFRVSRPEKGLLRIMQ